MTTPWQTKSSDIVYETPWIVVKRNQVINQVQRPLTYSIVEARHPSVFIIALDSDGRVLLERHYRYTIDQTAWELPAGHSDGQDSITAAKRELKEETGFESSDWEDLGVLYQAVGIANLPMHVCVARDAYQTSAPSDEDEHIVSSQFFHPEEIDAMIKNGEIISAGEIAAYYKFKAQERE